MNYIKYILTSIILLNFIGCSSNELSAVKESRVIHKDASAEAKQRKRTKYLAYEHRVSIDLPKTDVVTAFYEIITFCADDATTQCTIIHTSLRTGSYSTSKIQVRILPSGVEPLLSLASKKGNVSNKSTDVIDLQDAIVNGNKRLEMLIQYQSRLSELEKKSGNNVESLIKIAQELSKVQSDIEYAEGKKAKLLQRTEMDIVHISLHTLSNTSFWGQISDSLSNFGENLSDGISEAIDALAYLIPWFIIFIFMFYIFRIVWRKTKTKGKAKTESE